MGPRGLNGFQEEGIAVLKADADTVKDVIDSYKSDKLQELKEGCHEGHHH
jgi:predicted Fe-Mo cluster-binding NifX family protein